MITRAGSGGVLRCIYALLLGTIAIALIYGGVRLASLGGSAYYLIAGVALAVSSVMIWRGQREGMWLYVAILLTTIVWSIWEVGFYGWALMPRIAAWLVVGAWMLTQLFRRSLRSPASTRFGRPGWGMLAGGVVAAIALGALLHPLRPKVVDPRFQAGVEAFPEAGRVAALAGLSGEWPHWGNDLGGARFSPLVEITPANVHRLRLAWRTPISHTQQGLDNGLEVTPLMIGDSLYACNGANEIFALDAETGRERWHVATAGKRGRSCRGVAYFRAPDRTGTCAERILAATGIATLVALDARTGRRCGDFGVAGTVNLLEGLSKAPRAYYYVTSAPAVIRGRIVLGGWVSDGQYRGEPSGVVRAFDAVTGRLAWAWDMGRPDRRGAPPPGETYTAGTPNSWAPISADERLGLVYLPTGNATPDYFGGLRRPFDDRYATSVVALDAQTGVPRWSFQTSHHDLWDYDVASQPTLLDLRTPRGVIPALLQVTKRGEVFLLDRTNGRPIRRVVERSVSTAGAAPGERPASTQPFSVDLPSLQNAEVRESDMWGITPLDQIYCRIKFRQARYAGTMTPPGLTPSISSPGYLGGMNWGSASIDLDRGVMIVNSSKMANYLRLLPRRRANELGLAPVGDDGNPKDVGGSAAQWGTPFGVEIAPFLSPLFVPCQAPPYGYLSAIDLVTGKLIWSRSLGTAEDSGPLGIHSQMPFPLGTPTSGGSMATRSGLTFIGATLDRKFRAFDERTGREVWKVSLPRGAFATPMTYLSPVSHRQIVLIAVGGSRALGQTGGAELMAFALPR